MAYRRYLGIIVPYLQTTIVLSLCRASRSLLQASHKAVCMAMSGKFSLSIGMMGICLVGRWYKKTNEERLLLGKGEGYDGEETSLLLLPPIRTRSMPQ